MKNRIFTGLYFIIAAVFLLIGPRTLFKVCGSDKMVMKCHWTIQAEAGISIILLIAGIAFFLLKSKESRIGISLLTLASSVSIILIQGLLIGGCQNKMMPCRSTAFPAIYIIGVITFLVSFGNIIYLSRSNRSVNYE